MAALSATDFSIPSTAPKCKSSRACRSRPMLSRLCAKTKMCSFYLRGTCARGESCAFAHDEKDLQPKPDLSCTKPCPDLLSVGHCSRLGCKYAHDGWEMRQLAIEEPNNHIAEREAANSSSQTASLPSFEGSCVSAHLVGQQLPTTPLVVSRMNEATLAGAVSLGEMIYHLTGIFLALYEAHPDMVTSLNVPAEALASATAKNAWAEAGVDSTALLSFQDIVRCLVPPVIAAQKAVDLQPSLRSSRRANQCAARLEDADAWSQCSTDDGSSQQSVSRCISSGCETPERCEDLDVEVRNTFIHFSPRSCSNRMRRARSLPGRLR